MPGFLTSVQALKAAGTYTLSRGGEARTGELRRVAAEEWLGLLVRMHIPDTLHTHLIPFLGAFPGLGQEPRLRLRKS